MPELVIVGVIGDVREILREHGHTYTPGDTRIIWDPNKADEVEAARDMFTRLRAKRYNAYAVKEKGEPGEAVSVFDPKAERLILMAPMAGG